MTNTALTLTSEVKRKRARPKRARRRIVEWERTKEHGIQGLKQGKQRPAKKRASEESIGRSHIQKK